jgi:polysaccharide deacetylase family protein (PEP-CTERM system associated)
MSYTVDGLSSPGTVPAPVFTTINDGALDSRAMLNVMSIDVEDHFQTEMMSRVVPRSAWKDMPSRVEENTRLLFELFNKHKTRATFFFLGWVAEQFPALVREAVELGHEVACHSYWHRPVYRITAEEFREDTKRAKAQIEDAGGAQVFGYRAPSFSMTPGTEWATQILGELGFLYDSSVHPIAHDLYGNRDAPREPYRIGTTGVMEIPISTIRFNNRNIPFSGGGYFRLLPYRVTHWAISRLNRKEKKPAVFYLHPWEIDQNPPKLKANLKTSIRQYIRTGNTARDLEHLLRDFHFSSICDVLGPIFAKPSSNDHSPGECRRVRGVSAWAELERESLKE